MLETLDVERPLSRPTQDKSPSPVVHRQCCVCQSDNNSRFFRQEGEYGLRICDRCHLVYLVGESHPEEFFSDARHGQDKAKDSDKKAIYYSFPEMYDKYPHVFDYYFERRFQRIQALNPRAKSLLDVGAGYGLWMKFCRERGWDVRGMDLSPEAASYARETLKLPVELATLDQYPKDRKYDVITFCDVLEHLEEPNRELQTLRSMMHEESVLYIQVPDVLGWRFPRGYSLLLPHHLWQFNFRALKGLLAKNGLKVVGRWSGTMGIVGYYEKRQASLFLRVFLGLVTRLGFGNRLMVACKRA